MKTILRLNGFNINLSADQMLLVTGYIKNWQRLPCQERIRLKKQAQGRKKSNMSKKKERVVTCTTS